MFQKNVELHPASWNAYDSLGEAYLKNGDKNLAVKNYQKSVELNPANENAVAALKKLEAQ
jgi:Flp pilus assembly protein TadD